MGPQGEAVTLSDDVRFEMAAQAASRERRNRPVILVVVAALALLVAGVAALAGLAARASAAAAYQDQLDAQARVQSMLSQLAVLKNAEAASTSGAAHDPNVRIASNMEGLALRAGLSRPSPPHESPEPRGGGITVKEYVYTNVRAPSLTPLLQWVRLAVEEVPGLELYKITSLKPDAAGWNMSVSFRRWERNG
jgi:hypothetical protein